MIAPPAPAPRIIAPPPMTPPPSGAAAPVSPPPRAPMAPQAPASRASFADVCAPSPVEKEAVFVVVYGAGGLGKSTFAAGAEAPFFVPVDPTGMRSVPRTIPRAVTPTTWAALLAILTFILQGEHTCKTLVLDTVNAIESLLFAHVCKMHGANSIETVLKGYGKGYTIASEMTAALVALLHEIRAKRGMNIVAICHARSKVQQDPSLPEYDLWTMQLNEKSAAIWIGAADTVMFAQAEANTRQEGEGFRERTKIEHTGRVLAHVRPGLGWVAKNRDFLTSPIALSWAVFDHAMSEGGELREALFARLATLSPAQRIEAEIRLAADGWSRAAAEIEINGAGE